MNTKRLRDLLTEAGKWPKLEPVESGKYRYYDCPLCGGEGKIAADFVSEGQEIYGEDSMVSCSIVGVQVYGIGDAMAAMEKLIPLLIEAAPALLDLVDATSTAFENGPVKPCADALKKLPQWMQESNAGDHRAAGETQ
jgi:hypothetical protein